jgi:hypothetical protein
MRTLELLDYLIDLARRIGFEIREEWLDGMGAGACEIRGQRILFVDQSIPPVDRLLQVAHSLQGREELEQIYILPEARAILERAA